MLAPALPEAPGPTALAFGRWSGDLARHASTAGEIEAGESTPVLSVGLLAVWAAIGIVATWKLVERGEGVATFALLGAVLGPLAIPVWYERREAAAARARPAWLSPGQLGPGPVDVLVGVRREGEVATLLRSAVEVLGGRLGRVVVARVVSGGALDADEWSPTTAGAAVQLEAESLLVPGCEPATVLVPGDPRRTLPALAERERCRVLLVSADLAPSLADRAAAVFLDRPDRRADRQRRRA